MDKILTIAIPTYNMQDYLCRCLDSLVVSEKYRKYLEVLVINDGSEDKSSEIAHQYSKQYPELFNVIDKENGNYGSCVNRGLKEAKGVYFRILDADDYFDTDGLERFVEILLTLEPTDMIVTNFKIVYQNEHRIERYCPPEKFYHAIYKYSDFNFKKEGCDRMLVMHAITYRTKLLRENSYEQQTGISYTDIEYDMIPIGYIQTLTFIDLYLYNYIIGREGQTVSQQSQSKALGAYLRLYNRLIVTYEEILKSNDVNRIDNARTVFFYVLNALYSYALFYNKKTVELNEKLHAIYIHIDKIDRGLRLKLFGIKIYQLPIFKIWYSTGMFCSNKILVKTLIKLSTIMHKIKSQW